MYGLLVTYSLLVTFCLGLRNLQDGLDGRIIGGRDANIEDYPYQVSLEFNGDHDCGGAIISDDWVVTAAHCVSGFSMSELQFRAGSSIRGSGGTLHPVEQIVSHPDYNSFNFDNDIAVVKVSEPFIYGPAVQPIPLATEDPAGGEIATATGWGFTIRDEVSFATQLQAVSLPIVDHETCQVKYSNILTRNMLCAGFEGGKGVCHSDSGGPLVVAGKLVGVVSFSIGCAEDDTPAIYADIAVLRDFVIANADVK